MLYEVHHLPVHFLKSNIEIFNQKADKSVWWRREPRLEIHQIPFWHLTTCNNLIFKSSFFRAKRDLIHRKTWYHNLFVESRLSHHPTDLSGFWGITSFDALKSTEYARKTMWIYMTSYGNIVIPQFFSISLSNLVSDGKLTKRA